MRLNRLYNPLWLCALTIAASMTMTIGTLFGCAAMQPGTATAGSTTTAPAASFDDQLHKAYQEVTIFRRASTKLMMAGSITAKQDQQYQDVLTLIKNTLDQAQGKSLSDPAQAAQLLAGALQQIANYQGAKQ